jgi:hypothetical protein
VWVEDLKSLCQEIVKSCYGVPCLFVEDNYDRPKPSTGMKWLFAQPGSGHADSPPVFLHLTVLSDLDEMRDDITKFITSHVYRVRETTNTDPQRVLVALQGSFMRVYSENAEPAGEQHV